ncbi:probable phospholipase A1 magnifin isoform X2 [Contarinia nasturtii]|nr:probable phospholipase A1 magnifin isoform X2 [Contarinia nasturtii]
MSTYNYKFYDGEIEAIKGLLGEREKIIFFFLGHEDFLQNPSGRNFKAARAQLLDTKATVCIVNYDFICGPNLIKDLHYFMAIKNRLPAVVDMSASFIQNIVDSPKLKIKLSTVYLSGFCLGGHVAGNVGHALKKIYKGKEAAAVIWAFDPPKFGYPYPMEEGKPRRVQKGDAGLVVVFHSSSFCVHDNIADVDVILNDGISQPGCENNLIVCRCNHNAAFVLREFIIYKSNYLLKTKQNIPYASSKNGTFVLDFINPSTQCKGTYTLKTGKIFGNNS